MAIRPHISLLKSLQACGEARTWAATQPDLETCWRTCNRTEWMIWLLHELGHQDDKAYRLYTCWCVRNTPLADGRTTWDLLTDDRSKAAVEVAEKFAIGEATQDELAAAWAAARAAWEAAWDAARAAGATGAAGAAAWAARAAGAAGDAIRAAGATGAAGAAAWAAEAAARAAGAAGAAAWAAQANYLRGIFPFAVLQDLVTNYLKTPASVAEKESV